MPLSRGTGALVEIIDETKVALYHPVGARRALAGAVSPPATLSLINDLMPVRDQGSSSTCVAQATACVAEYHARKAMNFRNFCSPQFIYNNRSNNNVDNGMFIGNALDILTKLGTCRETTFSFGSSNMPPDMPAPAVKEALDFRISSYAAIPRLTVPNNESITDLKLALQNNGPAIISFIVYDTNSSTPWIPVSGTTGEGHAMAVVGYDSTGFILRNSWGSSWNGNGYTNYPYTDYVTGYMTGLYTTVDAANPDIVYPVDPLPSDVTNSNNCCSCVIA